ncbi:alpha/beta hydrolase-fold protein [Novosphingobium sp. ST904]|uniref:alpha/beta hydrolase-fold protein n=1 Tax=Novosphingobium sp. ST904 TaxID=1684385 RepID=UPI0006C8E10C|nr:alpha/beta hydrolase-fold protein [Novosphingobium sp. ST904]KPH61243.1 esterase [Novosphingobium sp. ST904]TCM35382.1 enterochelin esterase family protein [Novosphingobium sp. ST904]
MVRRKIVSSAALLAAVSAIAAALPATAQMQSPKLDPSTCVMPPFYSGPAPYKSVEQLPDRRVTFRLCAPNASEVLLTSTDIATVIPMGFPAGTPQGLAMAKDATGLWTVTTARPVPADTYRFAFRVDGVKTVDPLGKTFSEELKGINSTFEVRGPEGDFQTWNPQVAHGAVSTIEYWSKSLGIARRAHVYTPPGYMKDGRKYPVLYLVHGAGDSDDSWTSVGRANAILDNLIAAGKVVPMIVVMPDGHTPLREGVMTLDNPDFGADLIGDLIPYVDAAYRSDARPEARAMAGLSMGGSHTLRNGLTHPDQFRWIGIFSMGLSKGNAFNGVETYAAKYDAELKRSAKELKLVYFAMGREDFLHETVAPTRALFDRYHIAHVYHETGGGHEWVNWRRYLADFAPRLFR